MSETLKKTLNALELISKIKDDQLRSNVLDDLHEYLYKGLREMCFNIVSGKVKLSESQKKLLFKHRKVISQLGAEKVPKIKRRKLVQQSGGFLPILLPIVSAVLGGLLNGAH